MSIHQRYLILPARGLQATPATATVHAFLTRLVPGGDERPLRARLSATVAAGSASSAGGTTKGRPKAQGRQRDGLPPIPGGTSFLLEIPDDDTALIDFLSHNLGLELVAEYPEGFVLVANDDLEQTKLIGLARAFMHDRRGGARAASILEIYAPQTSDLRATKILDEDLHELWPFADTEIFTLDVSIQTAGTFAEYEENEPVRRKKETDRKFDSRHRKWSKALHELRSVWASRQHTRRAEFLDFLRPYEPALLERKDGEPAALPDSFTIRLQMRGRGFNDVIRNYPHVFEVTSAQSARAVPASGNLPSPEGQFRLLPPQNGAPAVCVVDSGVMEGHRLLRAAMPGSTRDDSRCFVPGRPMMISPIVPRMEDTALGSPGQCCTVARSRKPAAPRLCVGFKTLACLSVIQMAELSFQETSGMLSCFRK